MPRLAKNSLLISFISFCFAAVIFAEDTTITTYYPSPYGSYNELQLYPHPAPVTTCDAGHKGTMYYDSDDNKIKVCNGANWVNIVFSP